METNKSPSVGAVIIGRNEGQRLVKCLQSVQACVDSFVYVDSGSTDGSVSHAKSVGAHVVELDMSIPFTAARARNNGAEALLQSSPKIKYIQFIDGDCQLQPEWVSFSTDFLEQNPDYAVACGRRRELHPDQTAYNALCDIEWNTPIGDALSCGGDALIRASSFQEVSGYQNAIIAGEEPEMCLRLRRTGWKIRRLDHEMTLHDAAMTTFKMWWKRTVRSGFAYMAVCHMHFHDKEHFWLREVLSIFAWGILFPVLLISLSFTAPWILLLGCILYLLQISRLKLNAPLPGKIGTIWAASLVAGKTPQALGILKYWRNYITKSTSKIIEYK